MLPRARVVAELLATQLLHSAAPVAAELPATTLLHSALYTPRPAACSRD